MISYKPTGVVPSLVTSFLPSGEIDEQGLRTAVEFHRQRGISTICVLGGTGEAHALSADERGRVMEIVIDASAATVDVIVGALAGSFGEVLADARRARDAGAKACMLAAPAFVRPSGDEVLRFVSEVADEAELPVVVFNTPTRSGFNMSYGLLMQLVGRCERVVGIKESSRDLDLFCRLRIELPERVSLLQGVDTLFLPSLAVRGDGGILAVAAAYPEICLAIEAAVSTGYLRRAQEAHERLVGLAELLFETSHPAPLKYALELRGVPSGTTRRPLYGMSSDHTKRLESCAASLERWMADRGLERGG